MRAKAHPGKRRAVRPSLAEAASGSTPRHCLPQEARPPAQDDGLPDVCPRATSSDSTRRGKWPRAGKSPRHTAHARDVGEQGGRPCAHGLAVWAPCEARGTASWIHPHKHPRARPSNSQSASSRPHERHTRLSRWETSDTLRPSLRESLASEKNTSQVRGTEGALRPSLHEPLISWGTLQTGAVHGHPQSTTLWVSSPHRRENRGTKRASGMPRSHSHW